MNELQDLVQERLEALGSPGEPMSYRAAADNSRGLVSHETIRDICKGTHSGRLRDRTAEGLALALRVPVQRIYEAAGVPRPAARWQWPEKFDRLSEPKRRLVEQVAAALLETEQRNMRRE